MGEFPSGQRGQTVNLLLSASVVRIHPLPPNKIPPKRVVFLFGLMRSIGVGPPKVVRRSRTKCATAFWDGEVGSTKILKLTARSRL